MDMGFVGVPFWSRNLLPNPRSGGREVMPLPGGVGDTWQKTLAFIVRRSVPFAPFRTPTRDSCGRGEEELDVRTSFQPTCGPRAGPLQFGDPGVWLGLRPELGSLQLAQRFEEAGLGIRFQPELGEGEVGKTRKF